MTPSQLLVDQFAALLTAELLNWEGAGSPQLCAVYSPFTPSANLQLADINIGSENVSPNYQATNAVLFTLPKERGIYGIVNWENGFTPIFDGMSVATYPTTVYGLALIDPTQTVLLASKLLDVPFVVNAPTDGESFDPVLFRFGAFAFAL